MSTTLSITIYVNKKMVTKRKFPDGKIKQTIIDAVRKNGLMTARQIDDLFNGHVKKDSIRGRRWELVHKDKILEEIKDTIQVNKYRDKVVTFYRLALETE